MTNSRRGFIGLTSLGLFGILPSQSSSFPFIHDLSESDPLINRYYPSTLSEHISAVVGAAHSNIDKVKELVDRRPELAKATWDWGFGDVESALGAASHMGRVDIAEYLISKGARPDIYTFAMMGKINAVKSMIADMPGIQTILGPHGFTLMHHAKIRLMRKNVEGLAKDTQEAMVEYLDSLGDADNGSTSLEVRDNEKETYLGKYSFGKGEDEYFEVKLNMRKMLSIGRGAAFGRSLNKVGKHIFSPGGGPSVRISFDVKDGFAKSVTIHDPDVILTAYRNK